ncbi:MAG: ABC transporter permease [Chloroflexi bacterium]|nr:ABC transporter permease [Chloroflexota bacterium]
MTERIAPAASGATITARKGRKLPPAWARAARLVRNQTVFVLLIVMILLASLLSPVFLTLDNMLNIMRAVSVLGIVALGQTVLLITANFDMSVSMVVPFAGMLAIGVQINGGGLIESLLVGLVGGIAVGVLNGVLVVKTRANPFLITLGTQTFVYSLSLIITEARTWYGQIEAYNIIGRGRLWDVIPYSVILFLVMAVALEFFLRRTVMGRSLYSLGLNEEATILSGINANRLKLLAFVFCGFCASVAGIVMSSRLNSTNASGAVGMDFDSLIAAVVGGTSLFGGSGGALRTVAGVMVLGVLNNLLVLTAVPYEAQLAVKGGVFLFVVGIDSLVRKAA